MVVRLETKKKRTGSTIQEAPRQVTITKTAINVEESERVLGATIRTL
jgi:hypothetical protein